MHKSELLLPAGDLVKLKTAIMYGADAVYAGTPDMSLRTQSKISLEDLQEGIKFVHDRGKKIYLTLNLYIHNEEAQKLPQFVNTLRELKPDGVLVADPGVFYYLKENAPELNRFVSTQANVCSAQTVKFWQSMGAKLCVLGREVTFAELTQEQIQYYVKNYAPFDKAGAYGIQEWIGCVGVTSINGSYYNVMGLPVQRLNQELHAFMNEKTDSFVDNFIY